MGGTEIMETERVCQRRLSGLSERVCRDGRPYKLAILDDHTGRLKAFMWEPFAFTHPRLVVPGPVEVLLRPRVLNGEPMADILHIRALDPIEVESGARLLPRALCPEIALGALDCLVAFHDRLKHLQLRGFINRVLLDPRIGTALLSCRASLNHHHRQRGGLLIHMMSGLEPVAAMARAACLKGEEVELTEVGFLLHDLGKLSTVSSGEQRPELGHLVRHESMTPILLAPHLEWLESTCPKAALTLRYILDFVAKPHSMRGYAKFVGAEIITMADQLNVAGVRDRGLSGLLRNSASTKQCA